MNPTTNQTNTSSSSSSNSSTKTTTSIKDIEFCLYLAYYLLGSVTFQQQQQQQHSNDTNAATNSNRWTFYWKSNPSYRLSKHESNIDDNNCTKSGNSDKHINNNTIEGRYHVQCLYIDLTIELEYNCNGNSNSNSNSNDDSDNDNGMKNHAATTNTSRSSISSNSSSCRWNRQQQLPVTCNIIFGSFSFVQQRGLSNSNDHHDTNIHGHSSYYVYTISPQQQRQVQNRNSHLSTISSSPVSFLQSIIYPHLSVQLQIDVTCTTSILLASTLASALVSFNPLSSSSVSVPSSLTSTTNQPTLHDYVITLDYPDFQMFHIPFHTIQIPLVSSSVTSSSTTTTTKTETNDNSNNHHHCSDPNTKVTDDTNNVNNKTKMTNEYSILPLWMGQRMLYQHQNYSNPSTTTNNSLTPVTTTATPDSTSTTSTAAAAAAINTTSPTKSMRVNNNSSGNKNRNITVTKAPQEQQQQQLNEENVWPLFLEWMETINRSYRKKSSDTKCNNLSSSVANHTRNTIDTETKQELQSNFIETKPNRDSNISTISSTSSNSNSDFVAVTTTTTTIIPLINASGALPNTTVTGTDQVTTKVATATTTPSTNNASTTTTTKTSNNSNKRKRIIIKGGTGVMNQKRYTNVVVSQPQQRNKR